MIPPTSILGLPSGESQWCKKQAHEEKLRGNKQVDGRVWGFSFVHAMDPVPRVWISAAATAGARAPWDPGPLQNCIV